jgi:primosomal replication protein N
MHLRALFRRRPTASMVISLIALFVALGGASYAAVSLPKNSVGTAQIKNNAVNYKKIATHTIGLQRIDATKVQVRVSGTCKDASAINTIAQGGKVTCQSTLPTEFGASSDSTSVGTTAATVVSKILPAGNYLLTAVSYATINPSNTAAGQQVQVTCTLSAASGSSQTRTAAIEVGQGTRTQTVALPMTFPTTVGSPQGTAHVDCVHAATTGTPDPTVTVQSTLNAIPTQSNN